MRINHAVIRRNLLYVGICLAALGHVSLSHAATYTVGQSLENEGAFQRFIQQSTGGKVAVPYGASPTVSKTAGGLLMRGVGPLGLTGAQIAVATRIPNARILGAARALAGGPLGLAILAAPFAIKWMQENGVLRNPDENNKEKPFLLEDEQSMYGYDCGVGVASSASAACQAYVSWWNDQFHPGAYFWQKLRSCDVAQCTFELRGGSLDGPIEDVQVRTVNRVVIGAPSYKPASWDEVEPKFQTSPEPNSIEEILKRGGKIEPLPDSSVSGPSSTQGPKTTTVGPDGKLTTKQEVTNITYNDNKVTTTTTTTTTTTNPDGTDPQTTTETEESTKPDTESDLCKQNPDILACSKPELDTPEGEIPKSQKNLTYQEESIWGTGSCPADKVMTTHTGQTLTVWDFQKTCQMVNSAVAPLMLVCASYAAFMILALGSKGVPE